MVNRRRALAIDTNYVINVFYITDPCASSPLYATFGDPAYVLYDAMRDGAEITPDAVRDVCIKKLEPPPRNAFRKTCISSNFAIVF